MSHLYAFGPFRLHPNEGRLLQDNTPVSLTPKAFDILLVLVRNAPRLVTKQLLLEEVWQDAHVEEANLTVHMSTIRRVLGDGQNGARYIETVPRRGYRFVAPVDLLQEPDPATAAATAAAAADAPGDPAPAESPAITADAGADAPSDPIADAATRSWMSRRTWSLLIGVTTVLAFAIVAWSVARSKSSAMPGGSSWEAMATQGRLTLVVSSDARLGDPALAPDGQMMAYVATDAQGQVDLYVARVGGGGQLQLTHDAAVEGHPRFAPDGEHVLFTRRSSPTVRQVCLVPTFGGGAPRVVTDGTDAAWSPRGDRVAFIGQESAGGPTALFTSALDGSDRRLILSAGNGYPFMRSPAWSHDGREIAVVRSPGGTAGNIWLVPAQGGTPQRFSQDRPEVWSDWPTFAADDAGIVHTSNRGGATNLWIQLRDAAAPPIRLTTGAGPDTSPTVSRDGAVAFLNAHGRDELRIHDLTSGSTHGLLTHAPYIWSPAISPDDREIAFSRDEVDGSWQIWTVPMQGGTPKRITWGALGAVHPRYTPDGRAVVYQSWYGLHHIWRVPREGGTPVAVTTGEFDDGYADPSPDGRWIAFARAEAGEERVYIAPLADGDATPARRLLDRPSSVPRWSPDGRLIAFSPGRGFDRGILVVGPDGQGERRLTDRGGWPVWFPDGKRIGYLVIGPDASQQIWTISLTDGESQHLDTVKFNGTNHPFAVSRDGHTLVSSNAVRVASEIWLLQRNHAAH